MKRLSLFALLCGAALFAGCGQRLLDFINNPTSPDFGEVDMSVGDLSMADMVGVDLATTDAQSDAAIDGGNEADGGRDMTAKPADMTKLPDLTEPSDFSTPCEALSLDGVHAIVTAGPETYYNVSGALTVEAWVYQTSQGPNAAAVAGHTGATATTTASYELLIDATGHVVFEVSNNGTTYQTVTSTGTVPLNTWTHVAGQLENGIANYTLSVYINGASAATSTSVALLFEPDSVTVPLNVGRLSSATSSSGLASDELPFAGYIHDVRFSTVDRYSTTATTVPTRLEPDANTFALYHFDEDSGSNASDSSSNAIPGALQQGAIFAAPPVCP